ncbi:acetyl-CoA synthetase-like protein [Anaeromyces robustus]|uniref:Acetyl-CoA synthetase-like protein n=1 Tax=Anaeromyces robustus TaxID=1754192 RepID=A0A1Y1VR70_9FUNG|nr:acetyl-CoA synthetase-like protein [Anaeromyces robustus]|eukprot:ORX63769.1 acetyl-CoA synthetase-like protein [Anaeromyces robustus]
MNQLIEKECYKLASLSQAKIYHSYLDDKNKSYFNIIKKYNIEGNVDLKKLMDGFQEIFKKNKILRTKFSVVEVDGKDSVCCKVDNDCVLNFEHYSSEDSENFIKPFDLSIAPLMRVGFIGNQTLIINIHRIIADNTSIDILVKQLDEYYNDNISYESSIQFSDYVNNQSKNLDFDADMNYLKNVFNKEYNILSLPKKDNYIKNYGSDVLLKQYSLSITGKTYYEIRDFIKNNNLNPKLFFICVYGFIMNKYSRQEYIYSSLINENRMKSTEDTIGLFTSIQPILINYNDNNILNDIYNELKVLLFHYEKQGFSFSDISNKLNLLNLNNGFIYDSMDTSEETTSHNSLFINKELTIDNNFILFLSKLYDFEFIFRVIEQNNHYTIIIDYNENLFEEIIIKNIAENYIEVIKNTDNFYKALHDIEYLKPQEKNRILNDFNNNKYEFQGEKLYHVEFNKMAKLHPDTCAIIFEGKKFTYKEIDKMSNSLANYLRKIGVKKNEIIPIVCERSYYYAVATLAVMKAGGAFLYVNPAFPNERINYFLNEAKAKIVLKYLLNPVYNKIVIDDSYYVYDLTKHNYDENINEIPNINNSEDLSCSFFTSGTTGQPKGTIIAHSNLFYFCKFGLTNNGEKEVIINNSVLLGFTPFSFILSVIEIFYALLNNKTIVFCNDEECNNPSLISNLINEYSVDLLASPPTRIKYYLNNENFRKAIAKVKNIGFGGEVVTLEHLQNIKKFANARFYCGYGCTEVTSVCTISQFSYDDIANGKLVTVGQPACNCELYILDKYLKPVPVGVVGEIFVGGYNVSRGYLNRENLTKERFIDNPYSEKKGKIYKTGDLGKWTNDGRILYMGRIDFQVKIRGLRIELSEIENVIKEIKDISYVVVIDKVRKNTSEKYLVGYYVSANKNLTGKDIRNYLKNKLPDYMIPQYFVRIYTIPFNSHGKLDRRALPEPNIDDMLIEDYIAPETDIEKKLCDMYSKIFDIEINKIGKNSNFFELGGDSLLAVKVLAMIEKELKIKLDIKDIISNVSIGNLATHIENVMKDDKYKVEIIEKRHSKEFPITSTQLGIYIDSVKNPNSVIYNMPISLKLNKNVSIERIKMGFKQLFQKQETFRTKYLEKEYNGKIEICGVIDDECELEFENYTYNNYNSFVRPFNLTEAPLIRIGFIDDEVLLIDSHHIIFDGVTMLMIKNELNKYYNDNEMQELEIQISDYAIDLYEKKNNGHYDYQMEYYKKMFECEYELLNIPKKEKTINKSLNTATNEIGNLGILDKRLDKFTSSSINEYIKKNEISKTAFFLSIYGYVLSKYSGQDVIYSSLLSANRSNHYIENMAGMFLSLQPILLKYNKDEDTLLDIIKKNMEIIADIYNNRDFSFYELFKSLNLENVNNTFIFQPRILMQHTPGDSIFDSTDDKSMFSETENPNHFVQNKISRYDIVFSVMDKNDYYFISIEYNTDLYDSRIINDILNSYTEVIKNISNFNSKTTDIEYIPKNEKSKIISKFNKIIGDKEHNEFYHEVFSLIANQNPDKCAITYNDIKISYSDLDKMTNSLAYYLRKSGVTRNDVIPIICDRSPFYIIGTLGISKAGGAYLPVDKKLPIDRIQYILEEVKPKIILHCNAKEIIDKLIDGKSNMYDLAYHDYSMNEDKIENINKPNDSCYVLYTSGTTGKPKGVLNSHFNIYNYVRNFNNEDAFCMSNLVLKNKDIHNVLAVTNFSFDAQHDEITFSLVHGLNIVLTDDIISNDISLLSKYIINHNVDMISTTPTRLKLFMENEDFTKSLNKIKAVILGGENLTRELCQDIHKYSSCKIFNSYGPSECAVVCTYKEINKNDRSKITIGKPLCNCAVYILDKYMKPVPVGVEGEIYIGGYGVGKGYINRKDLTKENFVENPFNYDSDDYNKIMYRTGDLGRWMNNGEIEYLGRIDFQVKIHGQRIELSEIESTIKEIKEIEDSVVIDKVKENGDKYLVCYYVINNETIKGKYIRNYLKNKLPLYMIPNYFKNIKSIPITTNGKLDRKGLPEPEIEDLVSEHYVAPETKIEEQICNIYGEILNIPTNEIGRMNDFYELGGDSVNAIRVISRIEKDLNIRLGMKDIMSKSVICDLGKYIEDIKNNNNESYQVEKIIKRNKKEFPITSQQLGVYIDSIKNPKSTVYNISRMFKFNKNIDIEKIKEGFNKIFEKQEILKSRYGEKLVNNKIEIYGFIDDECKLEFEEYSYENINEFVRPF